MRLRILSGVVLALVLFLIGSMAVFKITCFDVWWHLKAGEYILQHHTVPTTDIFSYTALGQTWVTHEWLFEVVLFLAYKLAALKGVILLNALVVVLGFVFTLLTLRRLKIEPIIGVPLVIMAAFLVTFRAFCRPHIVTEALLALYLLFLLSFKYLPHSTLRNLLWLLLPVQLIWANTHSGMVLGIGLVLGFALSELIQRWLSRRVNWISGQTVEPRNSLFLLGLGLAMLAVSFLNPNFHRALLYPLTITGEPIFSGGIKELQSPLSKVCWSSDFFICFVLLFVVGLASFVLTRRRLDLTGLALFAVAMLAAALALRNLPIFGVVAVPVVALNLQAVLARSGNRSPGTLSVFAPKTGGVPILPRTLAAASPWALIGACLILLMIVFGRGVRICNDVRRPAFGYDERIFPVKAADFIDRNPVPGNIFSTMEYNGYFIWRFFPKRRVFIDGRLDVFGEKWFSIYGRMFWSGPEFDDEAGKFDFTCCILPQPPSNSEGTRNYIGRTLGTRKDWVLVYWDDLSLIYVLDNEANQELIRRHAYRATVPLLLGLPLPADPQQQLDEAQRAVQELPRSPLASTILGVAYTQLGRAEEAKSAFTRALMIDPDYTEALVALGMLYLRTQNTTQALATLERALKHELDNVVALYNIGLIYARNGRFSKAEEYLLRAVKVSPGMAPAYNTLGDIYAQQGRPDSARRMWLTTLRIDPENEHARERLSQTR
jgi:Tfp pilus assembly protein PilF